MESDPGLKSQLCHYVTLREQLNLSKPTFPPLENWDSNSTTLKGLLYGLNAGKKTNMYISLSNARSVISAKQMFTYKGAKALEGPYTLTTCEMNIFGAAYHLYNVGFSYTLLIHIF